MKQTTTADTNTKINANTKAVLLARLRAVPKDIGLTGVLHLVEQIRRPMAPPTVADFARMWNFSGGISRRQKLVERAKREQEVESWLADAQAAEDNHSLPSGCLTGGPNV